MHTIGASLRCSPPPCAQQMPVWGTTAATTRLAATAPSVFRAWLGQVLMLCGEDQGTLDREGV